MRGTLMEVSIRSPFRVRISGWVMGFDGMPKACCEKSAEPWRDFSMTAGGLSKNVLFGNNSRVKACHDESGRP